MYGLLDSLEKDIIPLYLTTRAMFSPYGVDTLKEVGIRSEVIDLVDRGRELDDIFDLIPHLYKKKIKDIKESVVALLKEYDLEKNIEHWIVDTDDIEHPTSMNR